MANWQFPGCFSASLRGVSLDLFEYHALVPTEPWISRNKEYHLTFVIVMPKQRPAQTFVSVNRWEKNRRNFFTALIGYRRELLSWSLHITVRCDNSNII